ncbi:MAG: DUF4019 domain-containing protein [bacterium]|nr:DUF4019 domain-containing protein [bacterium]
MKTVIVFAICVLIVLAVPALKADDAKVKAAQEAAKAWLKLVDDGAYAKSWDEASSLFRSKVPRAKWEALVGQVRGPLGAAKTRKLRGAEYATELPAVPDGEYVVIQFDTAFGRRSSAVETSAPMLDKDGQWRVSGYFIR